MSSDEGAMVELSFVRGNGAWGTLTFGADGTLRSIDPLAREILQFVGSEPRSEVFSQLTASDRGVINQLCLAAQKGRSGWGHLILRRSGAGSRCSVLALPVQDVAGELAGICVALRDEAGGRRIETATVSYSSGLLAAVNRERRQMVRQLHDQLCPHILGVAFLGKSIVQGLPPQSSEAVHLQQLIEQLNSAVRQAQLMVRGGECTGLASSNFGITLRELTQFLPSHCFCEVQVEDTPVPLPAAMAWEGPRIAQEAMLNLARHASATRARIRFHSPIPGFCQLDIGDNGCGFDALTSEEPRLGIELMRLRAWEAGGGLAIHTVTGRGTIVTFLIEVPT